MSVGGLDDLGEDAAGRARVYEGYSGAADPGPRVLVDQPQAGRRQRSKRVLDRRDSVGDVVQAGAPAGQELAHRRVWGKWLEQLDVTVANVQQRGFDALLGDRFTVHERHPES